jgi:hypothetical protein
LSTARLNSAVIPPVLHPTTPTCRHSWSGGYEATLAGMAAYAKQQGYKKVTGYVVDVPSAIEGAKTLGVAAFKADGRT